MEIIAKVDEVHHVAKKILEIAKTKNIKVLFLNGDLGTGKTFLTNAIAQILNIKLPITSPSFNFMNSYPGLIHIDAYNIKNGSLEEFEDYFQDNLVVVEWGKLVRDFFEKKIIINIYYINDQERKYEIIF